MLARVAPSFARSCIATKFGMVMAASTPRIATTIISSISVKPRCVFTVSSLMPVAARNPCGWTRSATRSSVSTGRAVPDTGRLNPITLRNTVPACPVPARTRRCARSPRLPIRTTLHVLHEAARAPCNPQSSRHPRGGLVHLPFAGLVEPGARLLHAVGDQLAVEGGGVDPQDVAGLLLLPARRVQHLE